MSGTFTLKQLRFTFTLSPQNPAQFSGSGNTLVIVGAKASATITCAGMPAFPAVDFYIYGLKQSDMNALTSLVFSNPSQSPPQTRNTVVIEANSGQGWYMVFNGQILTAGPDYSSVPEVPLHGTAQFLGFESLAPTAALSYPGPSTPVATIAQDISNAMGRGLIENNGVTASLTGPWYFDGTSTKQLRKLKAAAGIDMYPDGIGPIAICPAGVPRNFTPFVLTPPQYQKYPVLDYNRGYVNLSAYFQPAFRFGGPVTVQGSAVPLANGTWRIGTLKHRLSSVMDGGPWFSDMLLQIPGSTPVTA